ncbi:MAG TPA: hypothetical protein VII49_09970 [Rhizomicrobium sp.]
MGSIQNDMAQPPIGTTGNRTFGNGGSLSDAATHAAQRVQHDAAAAARDVKGQAADLAEKTKQTGAERMEKVAGAVHTAADSIGKDVPEAAGYIHRAGNGLENASRFLRNNSIEDLLNKATQLARDQPAAFIGGSIAAGFLVARFLMSSAGATKQNTKA